MKLAPSLLSADFSRLLEEIHEVAPLASRLHWDVMDGHFVPNLTFGPPVVNATRGKTDLPFEIHLMIDHPADYAPQFVVRPGDTIIFHVEAEDPPDSTLAAIQRVGARAGVSLRPATPIERLEPLLDRVAMVLVMSVEPGFGGQAFLSDATDRIRAVARRIGHRSIEIGVDGGLHAGNVRAAVAAGAEVVVAGSSIFGAPNRIAAMRALLEAAQ
jgi:ribulose-phosphate 3-epimerase